MRTATLAAGLAAAALAVGCALQRAGPAEPAPVLAIDADAVEIAPAELRGLELLHAVELSASHSQFGGFSGLLVEGDDVLAVTDQGWLLSARIQDGALLRLVDASFVPLPGDSGRGRKSSSDAEGLARLDGRIAITFERDHRVEFLDGGSITGELRDRRFESLPSNNGLEALATLPGGNLLAIAEAPRGRRFPFFVLRPEGGAAAGFLPKAGRHYITGADVGPDGRLYLLRRDWSPIAGVSARVERYRLDDAGLPHAETREVLAAFESISGIDNMEGISVWRAPDGALRLALISDDNFNAVQRTLLMVFEVDE